MRCRLILLAALCAVAATGCSVVPTVVQTPLVIPSNDFEFVWSQTVEVIDEYFDVASENRINGLIETYPQTTPTLLEPWRRDAVDAADRLEATLQTVRRKAFVRVTPAQGGYSVHVEVHKELEDLPHPAYATTGDAIFRTEQTLHREQQIVGPLPVARGWIPQGRDWKLEMQMLNDLACRFGLQ